MCGRFTLHHSWAEVHAMYSLTRPADTGRNVPARYNIAPTQDVLFVADRDGERRLMDGRWWLVPHWAKELQSKYPMLNARSEDAHTKPAFRDAYKTHRCLIPADGYYEWTVNDQDGKKDPWLIGLPDGEPYSFAGLWAYNNALDVTSCTVLTAAADPAIAHIHKRMPIILEPSVYDTWLDPVTPVDNARAVLKSHLGGALTYVRVGRQVNKASYDAPDCIDPLD